MQQRKPGWLKVKIPSGKDFNELNNLIKKNNLHTICHSAKCPNIAECFSNRTATFMILGDKCTRNCHYCNVSQGKPADIDKDDPKKIADAVKKLGIRYAVITSVTRDDLKDGGASVFSDTVREIKLLNPAIKIELLVPDFKGNAWAVEKIVESGADVIGHNIEVTESLFNRLRPMGNYQLSLGILKNIKKINPKQKTKSGLMVGLGETKRDIIKTIKDLRKAEVDFLTVGQYLQPRKGLAEVKKFYFPQEFKEMRKIAFEFGFEHVEAGPLVRSSYHAEKLDKMV